MLFIPMTTVSLLSGCSPNQQDVDRTRADALSNYQAPPADSTNENQTIIHGKVISISDGDTIDVLDQSRKTIRIRLFGVDAPETGQPFSKNAKQFISSRVGGKIVDVIQRDRDRFGRAIGDVIIEGRRLSVDIVAAGLAWHYVQFAPNDQELASAERFARQSKLGLWSDSRHVPPWEWRKLSKEQRDQLR
jgi:micrococcal nuclease